MSAEQIKEGAALRDAGIAVALANEDAEWRARYREAALAGLLPGGTLGCEVLFFSSEDVRKRVEMTGGIGEPHHPNVWSAAFASLLRHLQRDYAVVESGSHRATMARARRRRIAIYRMELKETQP